MGSTRPRPSGSSPHGIEPDGPFSERERLKEKSALSFSILNSNVLGPAHMKIRESLDVLNTSYSILLKHDKNDINGF